MMRKLILTTVVVTFFIITLNAQVGIGTTTPNVSSVLELSSTTKAFIPPRMTTAQRDLIPNPVAGMEIFNTTTTCIEIYRGSSWYNLCTNSSSAPISSLYVPGGYQGWNPATAPTISGVVGQANKLDGFIYITGADLFFKYTTAPDWNHINYGTSGGLQQFDTSVNAAGMSVLTTGYYYVTADLNPSVFGWTATKTNWSIIGDATPGGWTTDTPMSYDSTSQTWKVTANMITAGSYKFRANDLWIIDMGITSAGKLAFSDNPFRGFDSTINNITVPANGNYTITLDLHSSGNYTYSAVKN